MFLAFSSGQVTPNQASDWIIHPTTSHTEVIETKTGLKITNGLIERSFRTEGGAGCTVEYRHLVSQQTFLRSLSPEGNITLNGSPFDIGGCEGK